VTDISTNGHKSLGLRATLESAGGSMKSATVLATQNDPFRLDTPAGHRNGAWLANTLDRLGVTGQRHLRGLHYVLIGQPKPDGKPYTNTDADWIWMSRTAAKAARWLGYIPFDRIIDQRNDEPVIKEWKPANPKPYVSVDVEIRVPDATDLSPFVWLDGFTESQPYHLVLVGEKSSLRPVLTAVANTYQADLYLPTGEISDTQIYRMAQSGAADGRPMIVFYFADCDPAGHQMSISVSRKLQAITTLEFHDLDWQVHQVALTPDQVREYGLPSTPLKDSERRADKWTAATGVEQTEIDALAALQPDLLRQLAGDAIAPFYDHTLSHRVWQAMHDWRGQAQLAVDDQASGHLLELHAVAGPRLDEKRQEIQQILDDIRIDASMFALPPIPEIPQPVITDLFPRPLCDSAWDFAEQCHQLINSRQYGGHS
jgi:hypothetical protein